MMTINIVNKYITDIFCLYEHITSLMKDNNDLNTISDDFDTYR